MKMFLSYMFKIHSIGCYFMASVRWMFHFIYYHFILWLNWLLDSFPWLSNIIRIMTHGMKCTSAPHTRLFLLSDKTIVWTVLQPGLSNSCTAKWRVAEDDKDKEEEESGICWNPKHHSITFSENVQGRDLVNSWKSTCLCKLSLCIPCK